MTTSSLWHVGRTSPTPPLARDATVDILVVGGGMTGLFAALEAARRGARTMLLEKDRLFAGATGRNAGFLMAAPEAHYTTSIESHGRELAREVWRFNRENLHAAWRILDSVGAGEAIERTGSAIAAVDDAERAMLDEDDGLLREDGFSVRLLNADKAAQATGSVSFRGALLVPDDGQLDPVRALTKVAIEAARRGAEIHEGSPVVSLTKEGGSWRAATSNGDTVRARAVICGLNAYSPELLAFARDRVRPVRGQLLATAPLPERIVPMPVYADRGFSYVRSAGTRVVAGGMRNLAVADEVGTIDATTPRLQDAIEAALGARWPKARDAAVTHRWSGTMGFSPDGLPWIGEVPGAAGLWTAFACTGHGWGYLPWAGRVLAALALGDGSKIPAWCGIDRSLVSA